MKAIKNIFLTVISFMLMSISGLKAQTGTPDKVNSPQGTKQIQTMPPDSLSKKESKKSYTHDSIDSRTNKKPVEKSPDMKHPRGDKMHQDGANPDALPDSTK